MFPEPLVVVVPTAVVMPPPFAVTPTVPVLPVEMFPFWATLRPAVTEMLPDVDVSVPPRVISLPTVMAE